MKHRTVQRSQLNFKSHGRTFRIPKHLSHSTPTPPSTWDYSKSESLSFPIDGNDNYGDCYYAAVCHGSQCYTGNSGTECSFDVSSLTARYLNIAGGDNGLDDSTIMPEWKSGVIGPNGPRKILDELTVDLSDLASWKLAFWAFGGLIWTCSLLDSWLDKTNPGDVWDDNGTTDPSAGHAMFLTGLKASGNVDTRTWGITPPIQVTQSGLQKSDSEFIVAFSLDHFNAAGICAFTGLTYDQKATLWVKCGGQSLPPSPFGPTPVPPTPSTVNSLTVGATLAPGTYPIGASALSPQVVTDLQAALTDLQALLQSPPQKGAPTVINWANLVQFLITDGPKILVIVQDFLAAISLKGK